MRFLVIGLGSMGKRRIRLLKKINDNYEIFGIDNNKERREKAKVEYGIKVFDTVIDAVSSYKFDGALICTSPLSHSKIMSQLLEYDFAIFSEINLISEGYENLINSNNKKLFLSSTFLYRRDIQWIINKVDNARVNYIYHVGQYLPDWHPWESYKDFFVYDKRSNGCREILAIEMPWIVQGFGKIKDMYIKKDNLSNLKIDYPDNYKINFTHENGSKGVVIVDIVSRCAIRNLEIFNEDLHIIWNGTPQSLQDYSIQKKKMLNITTYKEIDKDNNYAANIIENSYMDEIKAFIALINGDDTKIKYSYKQDLEILNILDMIEEK